MENPVLEIKRNWYALYTNSRCELKVSEGLSEAGINNYLPMKVTNKIWSDRRKKVSEPYFPGYVFINVCEKERLKALQVKHVVKCVSDAGRPAIVPDWQVEGMRKMFECSENVSVIEGLVFGDEVEVCDGPLKGTIGIVKEINGSEHLAIAIKLLNRSVIAHLSSEKIIKRVP